MDITFDFKSNFFVAPTDEQVKRRQEQLKKQEDVIINMGDIQKMCHRILDVKNKTDIVFFFTKRLMYFGVMNKEEMNEQMKMWKDMAKEGKIEMNPENNNEYNIGGKTVYTLVVQNPKSGICPLSVALSLTMVNGTTFVFTKKENRDAIYGYVKKFCSK